MQMEYMTYDMPLGIMIIKILYSLQPCDAMKQKLWILFYILLCKHYVNAYHPCAFRTNIFNNNTTINFTKIRKCIDLKLCHNVTNTFVHLQYVWIFREIMV